MGTKKHRYNIYEAPLHFECEYIGYMEYIYIESLSDQGHFGHQMSKMGLVTSAHLHGS